MTEVGSSTGIPPAKGHTPFQARRILGVPVAALNMEEALDRIDEAIALRHPFRIGVVNAAKIVNMQRDPLLQSDVLSSDLILADGASVVLAGRILGKPLPERVTGIDLMAGILKRGDRKGYRVFCLGATDDVLEKTVARIRREYPGVVIAGQRNGYFDEAAEKEVAATIAASRPDVLFVAITSPKKEKFMARYGDEMAVPVCHGVGGSFDVMAGKVDRAPVAWQRLGLEWLYRLKQEPRRLWRRYLETNSLFLLLLAKEFLRELPGRIGGRDSGE